MFCMKCGKQVNDAAVFCPDCGERLPKVQADPIGGASGGAASMQGADPEIMPTQPVSPVNPIVHDVPPSPSPKKAGPSAKPKAGGGTIAINKKGFIIGIAVLCVALIAAAVCVALFVGALGHNPINGGGGSLPGTSAEDPGQTTIVVGSGATVSSSSSSSSAQDQEQTTPAVQKKPGAIFVSQVDNTDYPQVRIYVNFTDQSGSQISSMSSDYVVIREFDSGGVEYIGDVVELAPIAIGDAVNVNLVLDQSGSMKDSSKMTNAKTAAKAFVSEITSTSGAVAEITSFDDQVYNRQPFTSERVLLDNAVDSLRPDGTTALYDSLYWALNRTNTKSGSRVVIAFTDGQENDSRTSRSDVIELSRTTGIPVYIIGIGNDVMSSDLESLAKSCNGSYYSAQTANLSSVLEGIYREIYEAQRGMFRVVFKSNCPGAGREYRTFKIAYSDIAPFEGECEHTYVPEKVISNDPLDISARDYVLPDSSTRVYSKSELEQLSTWELYLARNEMFARYGRGFKNEDLVYYFNSKSWYTQKYTADEFDNSGFTLTKTEEANAATMLEIEKARNSPYITQNRQK